MECLRSGYLLSTSGSARFFIRSGYMGKTPPPLCCGGGKISQLWRERDGITDWDLKREV